MEGIPKTVLRGHDRLISSICSCSNFIFSADELGNLVAWNTKNWEIITQLKLELSSITTVSAVESLVSPSSPCSSPVIKLFIQTKSGKILVYAFNGKEFSSLSEENFSCGTYTFCRMSTLSLNDSADQSQSRLFITFPDAKVENTISVLDFSSKNYLLKAFKCESLKSASTGMCLFTKLYKSTSSSDDNFIILICGFESGHLVILKLFTNGNGRHEHEIIFENKIMEESCISAALNLSENTNNTGTIVAVGAGNSIKIIRNIFVDFNGSDSKSIEIPVNGCNSVSIRPDGKLFVTAGWDAKIRYFSLKSGKLLAVLDHHYDVITDLIVEQDYSLAASSDGTISLWTLFI